ncbi:MAG TPA: hypothetical protein P5077_03220 [bacterium]|nr:hypothetical protein [bacterium]
MKQRFFKLIVAALGFLLGMSLLGQEEAEECDCEMAGTADLAADEDGYDTGIICAYGPGPSPFGCDCSLINID